MRIKSGTPCDQLIVDEAEVIARSSQPMARMLELVRRLDDLAASQLDALRDCAYTKHSSRHEARQDQVFALHSDLINLEINVSDLIKRVGVLYDKIGSVEVMRCAVENLDSRLREAERRGV